MSFSTDILLVLLLAIIAQATNIDLANNTTFLLLLLLILAGFNGGVQSNCCSGNFLNQRSYI